MLLNSHDLVFLVTYSRLRRAIMWCDGYTKFDLAVGKEREVLNLCRDEKRMQAAQKEGGGPKQTKYEERLR